MLEKTAKNNNQLSLNLTKVEALNKPVGWEIFDGEQELSIGRIKYASVQKETDLGGFDLTAAVEEHPDHLFVKVLAIKKDEPNDNGDSFSGEELKKAAETFIGVPVFCNHQNDDIEKARGKVVHAWYDTEVGGIWTINMVDKVAYPKLARGIQEGYISGTSMGCQVHHSLCSICHNKAHTADEYCSHVKNQKTKKFSGKVKCAFHKSKCKPDEKCPICDCEKNASTEHEYKESLVYEHNYGLKFIEDSFVVNPACHDCLVDCVLNVPEYAKKVASIQSKMEKIAREKSTEKLTKLAGMTEIGLLNKAMKFMEVVAKSMMDQKDSVSMEYVSDIVDVLANTQTVTDELIEMGYGQLQSPPTLQDPEQVGDAVSLGGKGQQTQPGAMTPTPGSQPAAPQAPQMGNATSAPLSDIGNITKPTFSPNAAKKIKEFEKVGSNINKRITSLLDIVEKYNEIRKAKVDFNLSKNGITVSANRTSESSGVELSAFIADKEVQSEKLEHYRQNGEDFWSDPDKAALEIISEIDKVASTLINQVKESGDIMNKQEKTAAANVTTEKQLENAKLEEYAGNRQGDAPSTVTEDQLGGSDAPNNTTTDSPQQRKGEPSNYTTELQLEKDLKEGDLARWESYANVTTEKQWEEFNRAVGAVLSEDQENHTTAAQLEDLRKNHRWTEPNVTTEGQLADKANWLETDNAWATKESAAAYAKALITAATNSLVDTIANYKRTPAEAVKAAKFISNDPHAQIKAAFLVLVNGMPTKIAKRQAEIQRASYFGKVASFTPAVKPVDALLACMGDHCLNLKAEDFVDAVRTIASSPEKMAKVEALATAKLNATPANNEVSFDKSAALEDAFNSVFANEEKKVVETADSDDDGLYQVRSTIDEIGIPLSEKAAFSRAAEKFAQSKIENNNAVLYSIEVDEENGTVATTLKEASKLTAEESANYNKFASSQKSALRDSIVKEAQMMGGEQPAGPGMGAGSPGGMAPGAPGAAPPMPPAAESLDSTTEDALEGGDEGGEAPKPPGTICPVCGTQDVDVVAGRGKCNNPECGSEFLVKVLLEITKYKGVTDTSKEEGEEGGEEEGLPGEGGDEGFAMPENETPTTPIAAMTKISPETMKKLASNKDWKLGSISPLTGKNNTFRIGKNVKGGEEYLCMDSGAKYAVYTAVDAKNPNNLYVEWRWLPKVADRECPSCKRAKAAWINALKQINMTDEQFDALSFKHKADTVLAMQDKGLFNTVKTASKSGSVIDQYKKAYLLNTDKFPYDSCVAKLANRFGENAIALSGPDKGKNLAECVCKSLKSASIYTDKLAIKIAETWKDKDACLECMEDYVRLGYDMEKAASVCQNLKIKYASSDELFAEAQADAFSNPLPQQQPPQRKPQIPNKGLFPQAPVAPQPQVAPPQKPPVGNAFQGGQGIGNPLGDNLPETFVEVELDGGIGQDVNVDQTGNSVTIELPMEAVQALDTALDTVLGPNDQDNMMGENSDVVVEENGENNEGEEEVEVELPFEDSDSNESSDDEGSESEEHEEHESNEEPEVQENTEFKEGDESDHLASYMHKGKQNRVGEINLDLSSVVAALAKQAGESEPKIEGAQDVVKDYTAGDGSVQGGEEKFDAKPPTVERNVATIGAEESDRNPQDKPLPKVPKGSGGEGNLEGEENFKAEDGVNMSGGAKGQGTSQASSNKTQKVADKKVTVKAPQDAVDGYSANKDHSKSGIPRTPFEKSKETPKFPEGGDGAFIEDEKSSIEFVPKAEKNAPEIPTEGKLLSKEKNEKNKPELVENVKGFVAAKTSDEKSKAVVSEAFRIAGKLVEAKRIEATELKNKVDELSRYDLNTLKDIEKALFSTAQKGLATEPDGVEQPVPIISEAANERSQGASLTEALRSLFSLDQQNKVASELTDANLRKTYKK